MIIETKNKKINLVLRTRKIVDITNSLKNKNFEEAFIKAYSICDREALSKIIYSLAENEDGKHYFNNSEEVYDYIDECRENEISINELYKKIAEALNEEGFFKKKMSKKELTEMTSNPLSNININELIRKSTEVAVSKMTERIMLEI